MRGAKTQRLSGKPWLLSSAAFGAGEGMGRTAEWWRRLLHALVERKLLFEQTVTLPPGGPVASFQSLHLSAQARGAARARVIAPDDSGDDTCGSCLPMF